MLRRETKKPKPKKFAKGLVILYLLFLGPGPRSLERTDIEHNNNDRKKAIKVYQRLLSGTSVCSTLSWVHMQAPS